MKKIIGTNYLGYTQQRNFAGLPFKNFEVRKVVDMYKFPAFLYFKLFNKSHQYYLNSFNDFDLNKVDILHFFNAVSYGNTPWVTTNVKHIPRYLGSKKSDILKGLNTLLQPQFKKLISISNANHNIQLSFLNEYIPQYAAEIQKKMMVLHPGQKQIIQSMDEKNIDANCLTLTIAASTGFFGKGGREILNAVDYLIAKKYHIKLNIISKMEYGDWASRTMQSDYVNAMKIINRHTKNIRTYGFISNEEVINIFKDSDIGLLPTYADTYGYSVLEAQATGCPVISTNIRSLPEINNNEIGWLIEVDKKGNGNALLDTEQDIKRYSNRLQESLINIIEHAYTNRIEIKRKGKLCLAHINKNHNLNEKVELLEQIYFQALKQ